MKKLFTNAIFYIVISCGGILHQPDPESNTHSITGAKKRVWVTMNEVNLQTRIYAFAKIINDSAHSCWYSRTDNFITDTVSLANLKSGDKAPLFVNNSQLLREISAKKQNLTTDRYFNCLESVQDAASCLANRKKEENYNKRLEHQLALVKQVLSNSEVLGGIAPPKKGYDIEVDFETVKELESLVTVAVDKLSAQMRKNSPDLATLSLYQCPHLDAATL